MQTQARYEEYEIDLRELIITLWSHKKFIIIFTLVITTLSILYVLVVTPIYEAKTVVDLGYYMDKNNEKKLFYEPQSISEELNIFFIEMEKNIKDKTSWMDSISVSKKQQSFIELSSFGINNEEAKAQIQKVLDFIHKKDEATMERILNKNKILLKDIEKQISEEKDVFLKAVDSKINYIQTFAIPIISEKIKEAEKQIKEAEKQIKEAEKQIKEASSQTKIKTNKGLSAEATIAIKNSLELDLSKEKSNLLELEASKQTFESEELPSLFLKKNYPLTTNETIKKLYNKKKEIEILQDNYENSSIVGKIITNEYPIKPKKKLTVAVSFVTSFVLSIFLVFFIEFIKTFKNEEKIKSLS